MPNLETINPLGWFILFDPLETVPANDIRGHASGTVCWCGPVVGEEGELVHNAADGREAYELGKRRYH